MVCEHPHLRNVQARRSRARPNAHPRASRDASVKTNFNQSQQLSHSVVTRTPHTKHEPDFFHQISTVAGAIGRHIHHHREAPSGAADLPESETSAWATTVTGFPGT